MGGGKDLEELKRRISGMEVQILSHYGIELPPEGKHGPCPACGPGRNSHRFRWNIKNGGFIWACNQCRGGDIFSLLIKTGKASGFFEAIEMAESIVGRVSTTDSGGKNDNDNRKQLTDMWQGAEILTGDDIVCEYLKNRGLSLEFRPVNIRAALKCYESSTKGEMPAMIARIQDKDGKPISLHRTYLRDAKKAEIESPRKLMKGTKKLNGAGIRLYPPFPDTLGIAEGIETACAAFELSKIPVWSAINATLLESWEPPAKPKIKNIIIFADKDENYCGQKSACVLAHRLTLAGYCVKIRIPYGYGDWLDVLNKKIKGKILQ